MMVEQAVQIKLDEQNRIGLATPAENDIVSLKDEASQTRFEGLIHVGQHGFLTGDQPTGRIMKLLPGPTGPISYLVIRTARLWGRNKIVPFELVSTVNTKGVRLSIDQRKFKELPDYRTDASITDEIGSALWKDEFLRVSDYHQIDVRVKNGFVSVTGHVTSMMNLHRVKSAVKNVKSTLGASIHLVVDDQLLLKVAEALIQVERIEGSHVFAKVQNGVVALSGKVVSADIRALAQQCAANVPEVRGVINFITAPGVDLDTEDQRFLQPAIGEKISFGDGGFGFVRQVIINRNNRRVVAMIIQGRLPGQQLKSAGETQPAERLAVIPVSLIRYITGYTGFLLIDSTETTLYQDFNPAGFVTPGADWVPPFPYCSDDVRFIAEE